MEILLAIVGCLLMLVWCVCACVPFYVMYRITKDLNELHKQVLEEEGN